MRISAIGPDHYFRKMCELISCRPGIVVAEREKPRARDCAGALTGRRGLAAYPVVNVITLLSVKAKPKSTVFR
jgi:hypothetical protein